MTGAITIPVGVNDIINGYGAIGIDAGGIEFTPTGGFNIGLHGPTLAYGHVDPASNNAYALGDSGFAWSYLWVAGTANIGSASVGGNIVPTANASYSLGSLSESWDNIYTYGVYQLENIFPLSESITIGSSGSGAGLSLANLYIYAEEPTNGFTETVYLQSGGYMTQSASGSSPSYTMILGASGPTTYNPITAILGSPNELQLRGNVILSGPITSCSGQPSGTIAAIGWVSGTTPGTATVCP
jgi:hypothetical protein